MQATNAQNCYAKTNGINGTGKGLIANVVESCYGTGPGIGIQAPSGVVHNSLGFAGSGGTGIQTFIASVSHGAGTTTISSTHNVDSF
jgi:hypothetical protein